MDAAGESSAESAVIAARVVARWKEIALVKVATPYTGDSDQFHYSSAGCRQWFDDAAHGPRGKNESQPQFSPDGKRIAHWYPRDGESRNVTENLSRACGWRRNLEHHARPRSQRAAGHLMPDGKSLLVSANDGTTTGLWIQPVEGAAKRIDTGRAVATAFVLAGCLRRAAWRSRSPAVNPGIPRSCIGSNRPKRKLTHHDL